MQDNGERVRHGWATDRELAAYYSVSRATIWRWVQSGKLPSPTKLSAGVTRWRWAEAAKGHCQTNWVGPVEPAIEAF